MMSPYMLQRKGLIDLGFEEAIGSFNWVDGHYVRPYSFKRRFT